MWAITSYYNPAHYQSRLENYKTFRKKLGLPLLTIEFSYDGEFQLNSSNADILIQVAGGDILWQKERLLNLAIKKIPKTIDNVAWLDCDIFFEDSNWSENAIRALKEANIVQLFSQAIHLKPRAEIGIPENIHEIWQGLVFNAMTTKKNLDYKALAPGLAWAGKKELLDEFGLYDAMIIGGGDSALTYAIYGEYELCKIHHQMNNMQYQHYLNWAIPFDKAINKKINYVDGKIYHMWHGRLKNRQYFNRYKSLLDLEFNPFDDIKLNTDNLWEIRKDSQDLKNYLLEYFKARKEDELLT
jgi:hypothetical protein